MDQKVIITGPGKCGTSYFTKLLSELGFDTGFDPTDSSVITGYEGAKEYTGFEWTIRGRHARKERMPRIIKCPHLCLDLLERADKWDWDIEHVYILMRDYKDVANHRWHYRHQKLRGPGTTPEVEYKRQYETKAAIFVGQLMYQVVSEDIPHTFLMFPRIVLDPWYVWSTCDLFKDIPYDRFKEAFDKIANKEYVHWGLEER